jgi:hypothetical protein
MTVKESTARRVGRGACLLQQRSELVPVEDFALEQDGRESVERVATVGQAFERPFVGMLKQQLLLLLGLCD